MILPWSQLLQKLFKIRIFSPSSPPCSSERKLFLNFIEYENTGPYLFGLRILWFFYDSILLHPVNTKKNHAFEITLFYFSADESSNSFGRSLEREEFEKRRLQTKGGHGKQESSPNTDLTNSKTPFYYINESDIKDETEGNTFSDIHSDDSNNNSLDADEAVYESANKWSPKLSETVEPLSTGQLSPYGYRSARVINTNSIDRMDQMSSEPSSTEINALYRSRRGNKIFRAAAMPSSEYAPSQNLRNSRMSKELKHGNEEAKQ